MNFPVNSVRNESQQEKQQDQKDKLRLLLKKKLQELQLSS